MMSGMHCSTIDSKFVRCLQAAARTPLAGEELKLGPLHVTIPGRECRLSTQDIVDLPAHCFDDLWKVCLQSKKYIIEAFCKLWI